MKLVIQTNGAQSLSLMRLVFAVLVGLAIVAVASGSQKPLSEHAFGDLHRLHRAPVDAAVERVDRESPARPYESAAEAGSDYPGNEGSPYRGEDPRPSVYDIWIDIRLLEAISRVA